MAAEHDYNRINETPEILLQKESETKADVWFSPAACQVTSSDLDGVCKDLFNRSHGAILVDVTDVVYGVLTIQRNPAIKSNIGLDEAARRLADCLCEIHSASTPY